MKELLKELKTLKGKMPINTYRTIRGQILSGNEKAAKTGMERIRKRMEEAYGNACD